MRRSRMRVFTAAVGAAMLFFAADPSFAQNPEQKPPDKAQAGEAKDAPKKVDEFAEAEKVLGGPAANPECLVLGRKVVILLMKDDLDTAFRHLDLYDRFGCPAGHIQSAYRCTARQGDLKANEKIESRAHGCWINPSAETQGTAAAPSGTTNR